MSSINSGKVVAGAIGAGVVINIGETLGNMVLFVDQIESANATLGLAFPGGGAIAGFIVLAFALGYLTAWLYAAIRPRFGAGPRTGLCAGLVVWGAFYLLNMYADVLMGITPTSLAVIYGIYSAVFMAAAGYVAGMLYTED